MKKKLAGLLVLIVVLTSSTFAANIEKNINKKALVTFSSLYKDVKDVKWDKTDDLIKATFTVDDHDLFAFFTTNGELIGVCKNLATTELPLFLQSELKRSRGDSWITELFELSKDNETAYFVTIENADQKVVLKSTDYASWSQYTKVKK